MVLISDDGDQAVLGQGLREGKEDGIGHDEYRKIE